MNNRREFLATLTAALAATGPGRVLAAPAPAPATPDDRAYWTSVLQRVAASSCGSSGTPT
jgi:hypothetical protein